MHCTKPAGHLPAGFFCACAHRAAASCAGQAPYGAGQAARRRERFLAGGIDALRKDAPRSGRPATITSEMESRIVLNTLHDKPINARHLSIGATTIRRVWQSNGLKPPPSRTLKLSGGQRFEDKLLDLLGPYMNPPDHALVFSCDETSQIQALNRISPGLPMESGRAGTATHDYKRHGTRRFFAALKPLDGSVFSMRQLGPATVSG